MTAAGPSVSGGQNWFFESVSTLLGRCKAAQRVSSQWKHLQTSARTREESPACHLPTRFHLKLSPRTVTEGRPWAQWGGCTTLQLPPRCSLRRELAGGEEVPAAASCCQRCRAEPAAHGCTGEFPGRSGEVIQLSPEGHSLPPVPPSGLQKRPLWPQHSVPARWDGAGDAWHGEKDHKQRPKTCCPCLKTFSVLPRERLCPLCCGDAVMPVPEQLAPRAGAPHRLPQTSDISPEPPLLPWPPK